MIRPDASGRFGAASRGQAQTAMTKFDFKILIFKDKTAKMFFLRSTGVQIPQDDDVHQEERIPKSIPQDDEEVDSPGLVPNSMHHRLQLVLQKQNPLSSSPKGDSPIPPSSSSWPSSASLVALASPMIFKSTMDWQLSKGCG
ncbi:hypothetical protein L2E82_12057 [Cichorium intybus]|uniref:Uncharacterized protein n=1 Tax=Cichorium intybus TaxID=13427 RepID=A0ACB9GG28_CICIN|nr:hypothetical protein L2E82_12057 [Cichorium intybus]